MKHVEIEGTGLGFACACGKTLHTKTLLEKHIADENKIEANETKAKLERTAEAVAPAAQEPAESPKPDEPANEPSEGSNAPEAPVAPPAPPAVQPEPRAVGPSSLPLDLNNLSLNQINFIGQTMAKSGMFPDVTDAAKALVKILAGKEIGVTPFQAMTNIHIIQGKATMGANLMAAKVKGTGKYDYRVMELSNTKCVILFKQRDPLAEGGWADLGTFPYAIEDAERAGLVKPGSSWIKYPANMLFARAISSGVRIYCPDVFNGNLVYVPEELGAQVDEDGEPIGRAA